MARLKRGAPGDAGKPGALQTGAARLGIRIAPALLERESAESEYELWPENLHAFDFFRLLGTQWRVAPLGGVIGLDYAAAIAMMRARRVKLAEQAALLEDLRAMEAAAIPEWNRKER